MTDVAALERYLDLYADYLGTLGTDAAALAQLVESDLPRDARARVISALNYVFKSVDLIPDGIDDIGFLDDAFVVRVAAKLAVDAGGSGGDLARLAGEAADIASFLEADHVRLENYVQGLRRSEARGRTVDDVLDDAAMRAEFLTEVAAWSAAYEIPSFTKQPKTLVKLKAFLSAKLP